MNYQIDKNQKQTNKPAYQLPTTVLFLLQSLFLVKFSFFVLSVFFFLFGGVIGCGEDDQLALLYSVFITGLPGELSHKMGFRSSVSQSGHPEEGKHEGLVRGNDVLTNGFIGFSLA